MDGKEIILACTGQVEIMGAQNHKSVVLTVVVILLCVTSLGAKPRRLQRMQTGIWGAPHIRLEVSQNSASVEYDCANGTIKGPLTLDRRGRFNLSGTYVREHGGPIRDNESLNSQPARYTGTMNGQTMNLTVTLARSDELIGTFRVVRGGPGRVFKCL